MRVYWICKQIDSSAKRSQQMNTVYKQEYLDSIKTYEAEMNREMMELARRTTVIGGNGTTWEKIFKALDGSAADMVKAVNETVIGVDSKVMYMTSDAIGNGIVKRVMQKNGQTIYRIFDAATMQMIDVSSADVELA